MLRTHRVAELGGQAVRQLGDARGDLVKVHGLLAPVPLLDVHGEKEGRRGGEELKKKKRDWKLLLKSGSVTAASFFPPLSLFRLSSLWLLSPSLPSLSLSQRVSRPGQEGVADFSNTLFSGERFAPFRFTSKSEPKGNIKKEGLERRERGAKERKTEIEFFSFAFLLLLFHSYPSKHHLLRDSTLRRRPAPTRGSSSRLGFILIVVVVAARRGKLLLLLLFPPVALVLNVLEEGRAKVVVEALACCCRRRRSV